MFARWSSLTLVISITLFHTPAQAEDTEDKGCPMQCGDCSKYKAKETWEGTNDGQCMRYTCQKQEDGHTDLSAVMCPDFIPGKNCKREEGKEGAPYPDCCPWARCPQ